MRPDDFYQALRSGQVPTLVLLYGAEDLLREKAEKLLRRALFPEGRDDFNDTRFRARETTAEQIRDALLTLPVFAPRRLVTIRDADQLPAAVQDDLLAYLRDPAPETCLLLVAEKIDQRRKFFQQFKKTGTLVEFKPLNERDIPGYVKQSLAEHQAQMTGDALDLFCAMVGTALHEVNAELDKLLAYSGSSAVIDVTEVKAVVSRGRAENIFAIGHAVGRGDQSRALQLVIRLQDSGEAPLKILALLVGHFRKLWKVRELDAGHQPRNQIARQAGVPSFALNDLIEQGRRFSRNDFMRFHERFVQTDLAMKSSGADPEALLEQLIMGLVRKD